MNDTKRTAARIWVGLLLGSACVVCCRSAAGEDGKRTRGRVIELAREYMANEDAARRAEILAEIGHWDEGLDDIASAIRPVPPVDAPTGYLPGDKFTLPHLRAKMTRLLPREGGPVSLHKDKKFRPAPGEEYMNWVHVPEHYDPKKPLGMVIQLHGGGGCDFQPRAGRYALETQAYMMQDLLRGGDFIAVCPSTPPMAPNKFSFPESEIHFNAIIEEYSTRYAVDPDRIYLMGMSMGGFGAWWHAFRHGDRFAMVAPIVGSWWTAYWPKLRGTMIYMLNGAFDNRDRHGGSTHVDYTRWAHERMKTLGIPHIDAEMPAGHARICGRPQLEALFDLIKTVRRDPYCPHVCAVSPFIFSRHWRKEQYLRRYPPQPYSRWVSVLEIGGEGVPVDCPARNARKTFAPQRRIMPTGAVDAENLGGNRFRVKATNVKRFALWLHPKMGVDFAKPIEIECIRLAIDPKTKTEVEAARTTLTRTAKPCLAAMLRYLGDRRDYGLIYHAVLEISVPESDT